MKNIFYNLIILIITTFICLHLFEFGLKKFNDLVNYSNKEKKISEKQPPKININQLNNVDEIEDKKKKGAVSVIPGAVYLRNKNFDILPFSGFSLKESIFGNENGYLVTYKSDRYGFRNNDKIWDKNPDTILIGDSFTHGAQVLDYDTIAGILNKNNNITLNLGYGGTGPLSQYAILKEYIASKKPKNIIWLYYEGNDMHDLRSELKDPTLLKYLNNRDFVQNLINRQDEIDKIHYEFIKNTKKEIQITQSDNQKIKFNFKQIIKKTFSFPRLKNFLFVSYSSIRSIPKEFEKISLLLKEISEENEATLYFVYLPEYYRFTDIKNFYYYKYKRDYTKIKKLMLDQNIYMIDFVEYFKNNINDPLDLFPFRMFGHYNPKGYKVIAEEIHKKTQ